MYKTSTKIFGKITLKNIHIDRLPDILANGVKSLMA